MDITALQNNSILSLSNTMSANNLLANYGKNSDTEANTTDDSVSISDEARRLFAQSYGQYNGMTASQSSDAGDGLLQSLAKSYTVKGETGQAADTAAQSADGSLLAATSQDAVSPASEDAANAGAQGGGQGGGGQGGNEDDEDSDDESIRQQISSLRARVSMLSSAITSGDTSAYSQVASLEAEISALTASLSA